MPTLRTASFALALAVLTASVVPIHAAPTPAAASARHTKLLRSAPAAGSSVAASPTEISLWFSKPVQARLTRVQLAGGSGGTITLDAPKTSDAGDTVVVAGLKGALPKGSYTVTWATTSRDSHVIKGSFAFTVAGSATAH